MRKSLYILLTTTMVFVALVAGIFVGRNSTGTMATLNPFSGNVASDTAPVQVNINTASKSDLTLLPGIGNTKATKIIEFRDEFGNFTRIEDLIYVDGFSYTTIEELRPYITVGG